MQINPINPNNTLINELADEPQWILGLIVAQLMILAVAECTGNDPFVALDQRSTLIAGYVRQYNRIIGCETSARRYAAIAMIERACNAEYTATAITTPDGIEFDYGFTFPGMGSGWDNPTVDLAWHRALVSAAGFDVIGVNDLFGAGVRVLVANPA